MVLNRHPTYFVKKEKQTAWQKFQCSVQRSTAGCKLLYFILPHILVDLVYPPELRSVLKNKRLISIENAYGSDLGSVLDGRKVVITECNRELLILSPWMKFSHWNNLVSILNALDAMAMEKNLSLFFWGYCGIINRKDPILIAKTSNCGLYRFCIDFLAEFLARYPSLMTTILISI